MSLVVDASVAIRWFYPLDYFEKAEALAASGERLAAPDLIVAEVANAAWKLVTFSNLDFDSARAAVHNVVNIVHDLVPAAELRDRAINIALELRHPAYDCFYLALAESRQTPLVTTDDRLIRRCSGSRFAPLVRNLID
jgi:predicted nucleic acid-binding protein